MFQGILIGLAIGFWPEVGLIVGATTVGVLFGQAIKAFIAKYKAKGEAKIKADATKAISKL